MERDSITSEINDDEWKEQNIFGIFFIEISAQFFLFSFFTASVNTVSQSVSQSVSQVVSHGLPTSGVNSDQQSYVTCVLIVRSLLAKLDRELNNMKLFVFSTSAQFLLITPNYVR